MTGTLKILVINPGSTSTKVAIFENEKEIISENLHHSEDELSQYVNVAEQFSMRFEVIESFLNNQGIHLNEIKGVVGRGGLLHPLQGGTYEVNEAMLKDLRSGVQGEHPSNLGGILAHAYAKRLGISAYIVNFSARQ